MTGNIDSATVATNAVNARVDTTSSDINRPFVFVADVDNASGSYERLYRDNSTTCFINTGTNTIGATEFISTGDNRIGGDAHVTGTVICSNFTNDGNITIQPQGTTQGRSVTIKGGVDDDGKGGNVIIGSGVDGEGGNVYFRGDNGDSTYRFAKAAQTAIEGFLSFESLTSDRTYTTDSTGTIALTSSNVATATTASNANKVDVNAATGSANYPILFHNIDVGTSGYSSIFYSDSTSDNAEVITMNPRSGKITATTFAGNATTATTATNCSRSVTGGNGLTGGGALTSSRTLAVGSGDGISVSADAVAVDSTVVRTSGAQSGISGGKTFAGTVTTNGVLNIRGNADLADNDILRFGSGDDCELFCNGSHMYMDLNSGIGNFIIRDGSTTRFTFDDNGTFTATGNVKGLNIQGTLQNSDVRNATASGSVGAKGTYALIASTHTSDKSPGTTSSGNLRYADADGGTTTSVSVSGTWRIMGRTAGQSTSYGVKQTTVRLRTA